MKLIATAVGLCVTASLLAGCGGSDSSESNGGGGGEASKYVDGATFSMALSSDPGNLDPQMTAVWQSAVQYHAWHAIALLVIGSLLLHFPHSRGFKLAAWLFVVGILLFAGSLYVIAATGVRSLGMITPLGGVAFLAGWAAVVWAAWRDVRRT